MKKIIVLMTLIAGSMASAQEFSRVVAENWSCRSTKGSMAVQFRLEEGKLKQGKIKAGKGTANLSQARSKSIDIELPLTASFGTHDTTDYTINLIRLDENDFEDGNENTTARAQVVIMSHSWVDCVGYSNAAQILNCKVSLERK